MQPACQPFYGGPWVTSILAARDNRSVYVMGGNAGVLEIAPNGKLSTPFQPCPVRAFWTAADVDGHGFLYFSGANGYLEVYRHAGTTWSTVVNANYQGAPWSMLIGVKARLDRDELTLPYGDHYADVFTANAFGTNQVKRSGFMYDNNDNRRCAWSLCNDPDTGLHFVGAGGNGIYRLDPRPNAISLTLVVSTKSIGCVTGLVREPEKDTWIAGAWDAKTSRMTICRVDPLRGVVVGILVSGPPPNSWSSAPFVTIAGSRHVCGLGRPFPGGSYPFLISFPGRPGASYVAAASFGHRPATSLGHGKRVHLALDALFLWSLQGGWPFQGFQGKLDTQGEARAAFHIPNVASLSGRRFYVAAVTVKNGQIDGVSEPVGVSIR